MTLARLILAVIPFGARAPRAEAGIIARQIAGRLVARFALHDAIDLRSVFLVAMNEDAPGSGSGHLIFGSVPEPVVASTYGRGVGASRALVGEWNEVASDRSLALTLVDVATESVIAATTLAVPADELHECEVRAASWLATALGHDAPAGGPAAASEGAYLSLLEALEHEVNATLLASSDAARSGDELEAALTGHVRALRLDPACAAAEDRLLILGAEAMEGERETAWAIGALETYLEQSPRAWRALYLLGVLRRGAGDRTGAILAWSRSDALQPLRDADLVTLAALEREVGASASAAAHQRRVTLTSEMRLERARSLAAAGDIGLALADLDALVLAEPAGPAAAQARRLRFRLRTPEADRALERAGALAVSGEAVELVEATALFARALALEPDLWEAHFGNGLIARQQGDHEAAIRAFRQALALWPGQADACHELGVMLLMTDRANEALGHLEAAAALRPHDPAYLADVGFALLRTGDLAGARDRLLRAQVQDAADPITRTYLRELARVEALVRGEA